MGLAIRDLPQGDAPREKLRRYGVKALTDAELLAILLRVGSPGEHVVALSHRLLQGGLYELSEKSVRELCRTRGIGVVKAQQIVAMCELARRISNEALVPKKKVTHSGQIGEYYLRRMRGEKQEKFIAVFLDSRNAIISERELTIGTVNATFIHPRELFREAVRESASGIIVVHNHPSGNPTPSREDITVTKQLKEASVVMGITLIDHLVIGSDSYVSVFDYLEAEKVTKPRRKV